MYSVFIVVDPDFGERLTELPPGVPVWIGDSPANTPVARRLWKERLAPDHLSGITIFNVQEGTAPSAALVGVLGDVDMHHGKYSADPPYRRVQVFGVRVDEHIREAMAEFGFNEFLGNADGFTATRPEDAVG